MTIAKLVVAYWSPLVVVSFGIPMVEERLTTGLLACPPLLPKDDKCWQQYGLQWTAFHMREPDRTAWHGSYDSLPLQAAAALRAAIDDANDKVLAELQWPQEYDRRASLLVAMDALQGMRYTLCTIEFRDCYADASTAEYALAEYCNVVDQLLRYIEVPLPGDREHFFDIAIRFDAFALAVHSITEFVGNNKPPGAGLVQPLLYPSRYTPNQICQRSLYPQPHFENEGFLESVEWKDEYGYLVPHLPVDAILSRIRHMIDVELSRWVVNLGAAEGHCGRGTSVHDPANCLVEEHHFHGILVEGNAERAASLEKHFFPVGSKHRRLNDITVLFGMLIPENVLQINKKLPTTDVDLLKIDVDVGHDFFLERILSGDMDSGILGLRPKVIHVEYAPWFPPPFSFWRDFDASSASDYDNDPTIGINPSLARLDSIAVQFDYVLLHVEGVNAVWLRREFAKAFPTALKHSTYVKWVLGAFCHPMARTFGDSRRFGRYDFRAWADPVASLDERGALIQTYLTSAMPDHPTWHLTWSDSASLREAV